MQPTTKSLLSANLAARLPELARAFREAKPFRHVVIDDFFDPAICAQLLQDFPRFDERYALNEVGHVGGKAVRTHVRDLSSSYRTVDDYIRTPEFLALISKISGIPDLLYDKDYIGGGTHENRDGQELDTHVDFNYHPVTKLHRRLNLIVYLNREWEEAWGGAIELQSNPWDQVNNTTKRVLPLFNRAVMFETNEVSWHGFPKIKLPPDKKHLSRKSFAIYLYTCDRPADETAPSHATVYVPDTRPDYIGVGTTLTQQHVQELDRRYTNLRNQLKFLYEREKEFEQRLSNQDRAILELRGALRLPLQGFATQPGACIGVWSDQWCAAEVEFSLRATRPVRGITLVALAPAALPGEQSLEITVGNRVHTERLVPGKRQTLRVPCPLAAGEDTRVTIKSSRSWKPCEHGASTDSRALAFHLQSAELEH